MSTPRTRHWVDGQEVCVAVSGTGQDLAPSAERLGVREARVEWIGHAN